jgi:hypothetical protein
MPSAPIQALTRDGHYVPVINVTDPRFAVPDDPDSLRKLLDASHDEERRNRRIPKFIMRWLLKSAAKRSLLVQPLFGGDAAFLDGMSTYVMKLGADNLVPPYDCPMDRRVAASPNLTLLRLRTQQVARLIADGVAAELAKAVAAPLHLINIAGGPAIDSLNALILLNKREASLLRRPIVIHVLDLDDAGPFFGNNALTALKADSGPLAGLDAVFDHAATIGTNRRRSARCCASLVWPALSSPPRPKAGCSNTAATPRSSPILRRCGPPM